MDKKTISLVSAFCVDVIAIVIGRVLEIMPDIVLYVLGVIAVGLLIFCIHEYHKSKKSPLLKLVGQVESMKRLNSADEILCQGTIKVLIKAVFNPVEASLPITQFALEISGVEIKTDSPPKEISKGSSWEGYFEIPEALKINNIHARLFARAGETRYYSPEFPVPFEKIGEGES